MQRLPIKVTIGGRKWEKMKLVSALGGEKKVWYVDVKKDDKDSGVLYLTGDGWSSFVKDHDLRFGYFLVFNYSAQMNYKVIPYDLSTFEKPYQQSIHDDTHQCLKRKWKSSQGFSMV